MQCFTIIIIVTATSLVALSLAASGEESEEASYHNDRALATKAESSEELRTEQQIEEEKRNSKARLLRDSPPSRKKASRRRVITYDENKKAYDAFADVLVKVLTVGAALIADTPFGTAAGIFMALISVSVQSSGDVWGQVKEKVDTRITQEMTRNHYDVVSRHFSTFTTVARLKQDNLEFDDFVDVVAARYDMLPYNFRVLGFSEEVATLLPTYTIFLVATAQDLIKSERLGRCGLATELTALRSQTVAAAKSLFRKRYENLRGSRSRGRWPDGSCTGLPCYWKYHLTFDDAYNDVRKEGLLSEVPGIFNDKQRDVKDEVIRTLIEPMNHFFNQSICREGCNCPSRIATHEIEMPYESECFGIVKGGSSRCTLPCDTYSESYNWCPYLDGYSASRYSYHHNFIGSLWEYCTKPVWSRCYPINLRIYGGEVVNVSRD